MDRVIKKLSKKGTSEEERANVFSYIESQIGKGTWTQEMVDLVHKEFEGETDADK